MRRTGSPVLAAHHLASLGRSLLVRPDAEFIAGRFGEMEPAPAGKGKDRFHDGRAMLPDKPFRGRKIGAVEDDQCAAGIGPADEIGRIKTAVKAGTVKGRVIAECLELPAKRRRKKGLCRRRIGRGKFHIIDFVMCWHAAVTPLPSCRMSSETGWTITGQPANHVSDMPA